MKVEKRIIFTEEEKETLSKARQIFEELDALTDDDEGCKFCPAQKHCCQHSFAPGCHIYNTMNLLVEMETN